MENQNIDIAYGAEPLGPRVVKVDALEDYRLHLVFTTGEHRIFDAKPLLVHRVFQPLQDVNVFQSVKVAYGSVYWAGDIDYCPDTLYAQSVPIEG